MYILLFISSWDCWPNWKFIICIMTLKESNIRVLLLDAMINTLIPFSYSMRVYLQSLWVQHTSVLLSLDRSELHWLITFEILQINSWGVESSVDPNTDNGDAGGCITKSKPLFWAAKNTQNKRQWRTGKNEQKPKLGKTRNKNKDTKNLWRETWNVKHGT